MHCISTGSDGGLRRTLGHHNNRGRLLVTAVDEVCLNILLKHAMSDCAVEQRCHLRITVCTAVYKWDAN